MNRWIIALSLLMVSCGQSPGTPASVVSNTAEPYDNPPSYPSANSQHDDGFGYSIAVSKDGRTLAVGSPGESSIATGIDGNQADNSAESAGAVYLFASHVLGSEHQAYIKASNTEAYDFFGQSITLSADGDTLAVGAPGEGDGSGAVYLFTRTNGTWSQQAYVKASNPGNRYGFGQSVTLSADGSTLAVGSPGETQGAGAVYLFTRGASGWSQQSMMVASNTKAYDVFGRSVSLSSDGTRLAVGAIGKDDSAGAVYLFAKSNAGWSQMAYMKPANSMRSDNFGQSVVMGDGGIVTVGAMGEGTYGLGTGAAYLFACNGSQQGYLKPSNPGVVL